MLIRFKEKKLKFEGNLYDICGLGNDTPYGYELTSMNARVYTLVYPHEEKVINIIETSTFFKAKDMKATIECHMPSATHGGARYVQGSHSYKKIALTLGIEEYEFNDEIVKEYKEHIFNLVIKPYACRIIGYDKELYLSLVGAKGYDREVGLLKTYMNDST